MGNGLRINEAMDMDMHGTPKWSLCLRAYDRFVTHYNRAPGASHSELESDFKALKAFAHAICEELHVMPALVADEPLQELCRFGGVNFTQCPLHWAASLRKKLSN